MSRFLDHPEDQARGCVSIIETTAMDMEVVRKLAVILRNGVPFEENMPLRLRGQHLCYNNAHFRTLLSFWDKMISKNHLLRVRFHYGTSCLHYARKASWQCTALTPTTPCHRFPPGGPIHIDVIRDRYTSNALV